MTTRLRVDVVVMLYMVLQHSSGPHGTLSSTCAAPLQISKEPMSPNNYKSQPKYDVALDKPR